MMMREENGEEKIDVELRHEFIGMQSKSQEIKCPFKQCEVHHTMVLNL
jgi:hypothetical protein